MMVDVAMSAQHFQLMYLQTCEALTDAYPQHEVIKRLLQPASDVFRTRGNRWIAIGAIPPHNF